MLDRLRGLFNRERRTQNNYLAEILYGQKFSIFLSNSEWIHNKNICFGSWSAGSPFFYILVRILEKGNFNSILELGMGESSKLITQIVRHRELEKIIIVENDLQWYNFFKEDLLMVKTEILLLERIKKSVFGHEVSYYDNLSVHLSGKKFGLVVVDGPQGSERFSRYQIVELIKNDLLNDDFIVIIDDAHRAGEKETIQATLAELDSQGRKYFTGRYSGLKDTFVICSESNYYFANLQ